MLNRYLGNKTDLLDPIMQVVDSRSRPGSLVCDIFSGSLAVSLRLKTSGYRVAANDINLFSAVYGQAYLLNSDVPEVPVDKLLPKGGREGFVSSAEEVLEALRGAEGYRFMDDRERLDSYRSLVAVLRYLEAASIEDLPQDYRRSDFFDAYTENGRHSEFTSSRGTTGRRRFFIGSNAQRIDIILNFLRLWRRSHSTPPTLHALLLAVLLDAVEKVSNTQGTYHDFPREVYDSRSLKPIRLVPPPLDDVIGRSTEHIVGREEDSLDFIAGVPDHDVLYIDPPYNFRQYTAYYFLPNVICRYPDLDDPEQYFQALRYVRGQNPADDFTSPFCKAAQFVPSLAKLIGRARAKTVVLSYFDGRNHWNDFKSDANGVGYRKLMEFFSSTLFKRGSIEVVPIDRLNYQSYGGYKARPIKEYLFVAAKT